jgi:rhodanese-related sulfurtransferase
MAFIKSVVITSVALISFSLPVQATPEGITSGKQLQTQAESVTTDISTNDLKVMLDDELEMVLIDIRTTDEVKNMGGTIDAAQNSVIPRGWLEFRASKVAQSKDTPIVVYCGAGIRSPLAAKTLQDMGYTNVKNYSAGFIGWRKAGLPIK